MIYPPYILLENMQVPQIPANPPTPLPKWYNFKCSVTIVFIPKCVLAKALKNNLC